MHAVTQSKCLNEEPEIHCRLYREEMFFPVIDIPGFCLYDQAKEFISEFEIISDECSASTGGLIINRKIVDRDPEI